MQPTKFQSKIFRGMFGGSEMLLILVLFRIASKTAQEAPKRPQDPQERPKRLQEAAKSAPGGSKRASRDSKSRSRGLKTFQDRPKRLQKTPRTLNIQKRHLEQLQRCPAKMPCHRMAGGHAKRWRAGGGVPPKGKAINFLQASRSFSNAQGPQIS